MSPVADQALPASHAPSVDGVAERLRHTAHTLEAVRSHLRTVMAALDSLDLAELGKALAILDAARRDGRMVFVAGNGGSATTATHFVCDLAKNTLMSGQPRIKAMALNDNPALLTAWANDSDYSRVFAEPLENFISEGDVLVAISTSGRSSNVLAAVEVARERGAAVISLTGSPGIPLGERSDIWLRTVCTDPAPAEDVHLAICHALTAALQIPCSSVSANGR
jgi:D-sedoheptulose 7-phosphate isomerase